MSVSNLRITALLTSYQCEKTIGRALDSVLRQTRLPDEIIVVDDGSTDESVKVIREYEKNGVKLLRRENGGPSAARNLGLRAATGDWVALLDGDDEWMTNKLEVVEKGARIFPGAAGFFSAVRILEGFEARESAGTEEWVLGLGELLQGCCILTTSAAVVHREKTLRLGGFRPANRYGEDWELWLRLVREGPIRRLPGTLVTYHLHDGGLHTRYVDSRKALTSSLFKASAHHIRHERWKGVPVVREGMLNHFSAFSYYASRERRLGLTLATGAVAAALSPRRGGYAAARCALRAVTGL